MFLLFNVKIRNLNKLKKLWNDFHRWRDFGSWVLMSWFHPVLVMVACETSFFIISTPSTNFFYSTIFFFLLPNFFLYSSEIFHRIFLIRNLNARNWYNRKAFDEISLCTNSIFKNWFLAFPFSHSIEWIHFLLLLSKEFNHKLSQLIQ